MRFYWDGLRSFAPVMWFYRFVLRSIAPVIRSYRDVLCSITPVIRSYRSVLAFVRACHTFLSGCLMFDHACCLPPVRQTERLAICCVPIPPWVVIAIRAFSDVAWLSGFVGSLRDCAFPYGYPDGIIGAAGLRNWRRGLCAFLRSRIGVVSFSAGRTLGLRAPDCAKESSTLWTLFTLRRGYVSAYTRRRPSTRKDPPESNLCSGGSGCIAMLPIRTIVQTRSAPKR